MVTELRDMAVARRAFRWAEHHLAVQAVLNKEIVAPIYVDDVKDPKYAFTWVGRRIYLSGDPGDATLRKEFNMLFNSQYVDGWLNFQIRFSVYPDRQEWVPALRELFWDGEFTEGTRQYYRLRLDDSIRGELPDGYEFAEVNQTLINKPYDNIERLAEEAVSERDGLEDFLGKSFGVAALRGREVAGWALSEYNTGDSFEVGIETVDSHRRKGIATTLARELYRAGYRRGYRQAGWHCWKSNEASVATARKLGMEHVKDYPSCSIHVPL